MVKNIIITILITFNSIMLFSQTGGSISGTVKDKKTGEKLTGVNITIKPNLLGDISNSKGYYKIEGIAEGNYQITFSIIGYDKVSKGIKIKEGKALKLNAVLQSKDQNIDEVVVTGKSEAREIRERAMPISVISMSQLSGTVNSISDVLTKTVGVTIRSSGGTGAASRLSVRGLEGKRIGFFVDETPLSDQSDFLDINDIPMDMIDRIEIYKGVVPAKFGGSSMGGAVNIVIKEYPDKYADISYTYESFNTHKITPIFKRNIKEKGLVMGIGGGYTYSDNDYTMESPYISGLKIKRNHDNFKKILVGGNLKATKWWFDEVEFEPVFIDTYREIQGIEYDIRKAHINSQAYIFANTLKKDNFLLEGLDLDMSTAVAYTKYGMTDTAKIWYDWYGNAYNSDSKYGGELGNRYASNSDNRKFTLLNKLNLEYLINEKHSINFNSVFTLAEGKPKDDLRELSLGKQTVFDSKMRSLTLGFTYDFRTINDKFLNSLTARFYYYTMNTKNTNIYGVGEINNIDLNKNDYGISNAMRYRFTDTFLGKISAGYDVRIPSESELLGDGYTIEPSGGLLPERNLSVNIGVMYDLLGKSNTNLQVELNGFYMYLNDMIRFTKGIFGAQYQNFGKMRTLGIEFEIKADVLPVLYAYGNLTYQDLRDVRDYEENSTIPNPTKDKRMPNIPYLMSNFGLEFHKENLFGGKGQNTRIFADLAFIEEYLYDFEMTNSQQRRIPQSISIDLGFEHSFLNQRLFISGKVRNITDEKILSEFNRPLPGRNFGVKLRYVFR